MDNEQVDAIVRQFMELAKNQVFIRATVHEKDTEQIGVRVNKIDACVLDGSQPEQTLACIIEYQMIDPIESPFSPYHPPPIYGYDPRGYFRSMIWNWDKLVSTPFTQNKPVVIYHLDHRRCLAVSDQVFLQHIARIQVTLSYYVVKEKNPIYKQLLECLFYRLSNFLIAQNRRWRETTGA